MQGRLDAVVVIDIEATCWEKEADRPAGQMSDIIEIGVAVVSLSRLETTHSASILVKPTRSTVGPFCTKLTTITQEMVDKDGIYFLEACERLRNEYRAHERTFVSYGDYDRKKFEKDCTDLKVRYPFGPRHLNIKNFAAQALGMSKEAGMDQTLQLMGMKLEGIHHRGGDDAKNIAKIYISLMRGMRSWFASHGTPIAGPRKGHGE